MLARIQTILPADADHVWHTLLQRDTFLYITRGMFRFSSSAAWPPQFHPGMEINTRLILFGVLPAWRHTLRIARVDPQAYLIESQEHGGLIRVWNHRLQIEPQTRDQCRYTDQIEIEAGVWTGLVWLFAHVFYRYRQMRWHKLIRSWPDQIAS